MPAIGSGTRTKVQLVLVVDDLEDNRELYVFALEREGFVVATACDGLEAIEKAEKLLPSAIVMDLAMPVMDGWEATRRIRAIPELARVPIFAVTAFTDARSRSDALAAGCDDCLSKPYTPADLAGRIRRALGGDAKLASGDTR